jgi:glutaredoxin
MKQQCTLLNVWLTWLGVPALALLVGLYRGWTAALVVVAVAVVAELLYLRFFPVLSASLGYGSVADEPADSTGAAVHEKIVLYTANVCPFCPIVRRRLERLREQLGFTLEEVDVTFRPGVVRSKGLKSVPVVEARGELLRGNATTAELAAFITGRRRNQ